MHIFVNAGDLGDVYLGKRLFFSSVMNICVCQFIVSFVFTRRVLVSVKVLVPVLKLHIEVDCSKR